MLKGMSRLVGHHLPSESTITLAAGPTWWSQPAMLFPVEYVLFVIMSAMDIVLTWVILQAGGRELNPIARWVIEQHGLNGMMAFKFAMVLLVVILCESIARRQMRTGRVVMWVSVLVTGAVVSWSGGLLFGHYAL